MLFQISLYCPFQAAFPVDNNLGFCSLAQLLLNLRQWQLIIPCSRHTIFLILYSNLLLNHCWTPEKEKLAKQAVPVCSTIFQSLHGIKKERKKYVRGENYMFYNIIYRNHVFLFYTECFLTWSEQQQKAVEGTKKHKILLCPPSFFSMAFPSHFSKTALICFHWWELHDQNYLCTFVCICWTNVSNRQTLPRACA